MSDTLEAGTVVEVMMGHLERYRVPSYVMERSLYMELIEQCLEEADDWIETYLKDQAKPEDLEWWPAYKDELRQVGSKMPWFPILAYMVVDRGCGCLVGEHLVAHDIIKRGQDPNVSDVFGGIQRESNFRYALMTFIGGHIDTLLRNYIDSQLEDTGDWQEFSAVIFIDA